MGLDCSHDAWSGPYSAFHVWRCKLAEVAGLPPLELMEGLYVPINDTSSIGIPTLYTEAIDARLPIRWDCLKPSALHELLHHSDCDGEIAPDRCGPIADALEELLPGYLTVKPAGI